MAEFVFIDWADRGSIGLTILKEKLQKAGISCKIVKIPKIIAQNILTMSRQEGAERQKTFEKIKKTLTNNVDIATTKFIGTNMFDWHGQTKWEGRIIQALKEEMPNKIFIGGGPAFNSNPKGFFLATKLDYAIRGEAEHALPILIKILQGKSSKKIAEVPGIIFNKRRKAIIMPRAKLDNNEIQNGKLAVAKSGKRLVYVITERGCANTCIFCDVPRKGTPVALSDEAVISGLIKLAKNPKVTQIHIFDDQLFYDRERSLRLFEKVAELGLNKRFSFRGLATVDSLLINGAPDTHLINVIKRANFKQIDLGIEALNDPMLKEIKSGRYTAIQAMKLVTALNSFGIRTQNFMLAGGIHTTATDFLESYYRMMAKETRRLLEKEEYGFMSIIFATKGTPIYEQAKRENALYDAKGNLAGPIPQGRIGIRFVIPHDPLLKTLFLQNIRKHKFEIDEFDIDNVIKIGKQLSTISPKAAELTKRLCIVRNRINILSKEYEHEHWKIYFHEVKRRLNQKGKKFTKSNLIELTQSNSMRRKIRELADRKMLQRIKMKRAIEKLQGIPRIRALKEMRQKTGFGEIIPKPIIESSQARRKH